MAQISRSRSVAASPHQVWGVLADFGSIGSWAANVDHSCVLEHGPTGSDVGTSRRIQVGRDTLVERIIEFDQPVALAYTIEGLPRRLRRVTNRWSLTPVSATSTEVTLTTTVDIGANPAAHLVERALCRFMSTQSDSMLDGLAARVEGR